MHIAAASAESFKLLCFIGFPPLGELGFSRNSWKFHRLPFVNADGAPDFRAGFEVRLQQGLEPRPNRRLTIACRARRSSASTTPVPRLEPRTGSFLWVPYDRCCTTAASAAIIESAQRIHNVDELGESAQFDRGKVAKHLVTLSRAVAVNNAGLPGRSKTLGECQVLGCRDRAHAYSYGSTLVACNE
jgi:hypothetical protein